MTRPLLPPMLFELRLDTISRLAKITFGEVDSRTGKLLLYVFGVSSWPSCSPV